MWTWTFCASWPSIVPSCERSGLFHFLHLRFGPPFTVELLLASHRCVSLVEVANVEQVGDLAEMYEEATRTLDLLTLHCPKLEVCRFTYGVDSRFAYACRGPMIKAITADSCTVRVGTNRSLQ
jgi:hypothetical protein